MPAKKPRSMPIIAEAMSIGITPICGVSVMGMRENESIKKNKRNTKSLNNSDFLLLRLSNKSSMHLGLFNNESPRHSVNPRAIDTVTGMATVKKPTNGCNGIDKCSITFDTNFNNM
jgi:hypothetical protein